MIEKIHRKADELAKWTAVLIGLSLPLSTALDSILLVLLALLWLLGGNFQVKFSIIRKNPVALAALAMCGITVLSLFYSHVNKGTLSDVKTLLLIPLLITLFQEERFRRYAWWGFLAAMMLTLILSYLIFFQILPEIHADKRYSFRPGTVFIGSIAQNFFMAFTTFLLATKARFTEAGFLSKTFAVLSFFAAVNVLFMVPSRTGQAVLIILVGFYFFEWLRWKGIIAAILIIILAAGIIYMIPNTAVHTRMAQLFQEYGEWQPGRATNMGSSTGLRMEFYHNSLKIIRENPLLGVGTGGFVDAYKKQVRNSPMISTDNPHNQYLLTAIELGLIGLGMLLILFATQWRMAARLPFRQEKMAAFAMLLAIITGCMFNSFLSDHAEGLFYVWTTGIIFAGLSAERNVEAAS
jgi:O-antigen ligase